MKAITITLAFIMYYGLHLAAQDNRPGTPIGGIVVKGGKNPVGDTGKPSGKSISEKGVSGPHKIVEINTDDHRTYTGGRKTEDQSAAKSISQKGVASTRVEDAAFLNTLFASNGKEKILDPALFVQVTSDSELPGMRVVFRKDHKVYKYLGDEQRIIQILRSANRPAACTDCTTRECNGTAYDCACVNGFCYCILCPEITKLKELED